MNEQRRICLTTSVFILFTCHILGKIVNVHISCIFVDKEDHLVISHVMYDPCMNKTTEPPVSCQSQACPQVVNILAKESCL